MQVFARHFFSNADAVERFSSIIRKLEMFADRTGWPVEMIASFLPNFPPPTVQTRKVKLTLSVSGSDEGAGSKVWEGFFSRESGMVMLIDADMQAFDKGEIVVLQQLCARMVKKDKAFGSGARTLVCMHKNPELNDLRIAQEAFYLSFALPGLPDNQVGADVGRLPRTYRELGDTFSGCLVIDTGHPAAQQVRTEIEEMRVRGLFRGFALEYYLGMRFAQLGQVVTTYLPTNPDHAVTDRSPEAVREMIRKDYDELRRSMIGELLVKHIAGLGMQERVAELVGEEAMLTVVELLTKKTF